MTRDEAMRAARDVLGYNDPEYDDVPSEDLVSVAFYEEGHSGPGWYAWNTEYPEEGSERLDDGV